MDRNDSEEYEISLFSFGKGALLNKIPESVSIITGDRFLQLSAEPFFSVLKRKHPVDIMLRILLMLYVRLCGSERFYRKQFRKYISRTEYDIAISYFNDVPHNYFNQGTNLFVSDYVQAKKKVAWIHNDPIDGNFDPDHCERIYRSFDHLICVSHAVMDRFCEFLPQYKEKLAVYHNRFPVQEIQELAAETSPYRGECFRIVTAARIDNLQKRIDGIVKLCARLRDDGVRNFCWHIVGNGPDLPGNQQLASELGVTESICFEGEKMNPFPYIKHADLFALYSAYEGFPMVIGEAQVLDTFILTTNYAAAKEQVLPEQGIIAENDEKFYQELKRLILCRN
jgi:hypothetical protein